MPHKSVFCLATSRTQAGQIVDQLKAARFPSNAISALLADNHTTHDFSHVNRTKAPEGAVAGAGMGGALGWIAGIGLLAIPGFGSFIDSSPVLAALLGVATGAAIGGISGGLIGMSIPKLKARRPEGRLQDGSILISVHTETPSEITQVEVIFAHAGGQGICTKSEETDPEDNRATEILASPAKPALKGPAR